MNALRLEKRRLPNRVRQDKGNADSVSLPVWVTGKPCSGVSASSKALSAGVKGRTLDEAATGVVAKELEQVEQLKERIVREGIDQEMGRAKGVQGGGASVWIG